MGTAMCCMRMSPTQHTKGVQIVHPKPPSLSKNLIHADTQEPTTQRRFLLHEEPLKLVDSSKRAAPKSCRKIEKVSRRISSENIMYPNINPARHSADDPALQHQPASVQEPQITKDPLITEQACDLSKLPQKEPNSHEEVSIGSFEAADAENPLHSPQFAKNRGSEDLVNDPQARTPVSLKKLAQIKIQGSFSGSGDSSSKPKTSFERCQQWSNQQSSGIASIQDHYIEKPPSQVGQSVMDCFSPKTDSCREPDEEITSAFSVPEVHYSIQISPITTPRSDIQPKILQKMAVQPNCAESTHRSQESKSHVISCRLRLKQIAGLGLNTETVAQQ